MRLATFETDGTEYFGIVVKNPVDNRDWVFEPAETCRYLSLYFSNRTTGYSVNMYDRLSSFSWPDTLVGCLKLEEEGMNELYELERLICDFLNFSDQALLFKVGHEVESVNLKAPIPRPRIYWGLVQNSPAFWRNNPERKIANFFPQGHNRPHGSVLGYGDPVVHPSEGRWGYNVELGVIIGKKGRNIPVEKAIDHVAGYTVVTDCAHAGFFFNINRSLGVEGKGLPDGVDWFTDATASWGGKKSDAMCPMGPYLVTKDEVGNPYDLLVYTRQSGLLRDRSHTAGMALGIERVIHWYSSFATLYPGDVIHMATMGVDGLPCPPEFNFSSDDYIETEIEKVGVLRNPVVIKEKNDWRPRESAGRRIHASPAVRELIEQGKEPIAEWKPQDTRHFWLLFGNCRGAKELEGISASCYPRFLNSPPSSIGVSSQEVSLPQRTSTIELGLELAFVIKRLASKVKKENACDYILGFTPLVSIFDRSFREELIEPATEQERNIPQVYGRWADNFNIVDTDIIEQQEEVIASGLEMSLEVDGLGTVAGNTKNYTLYPSQIIEFISEYITLFPGDIITLGNVMKKIVVEPPVGSLNGRGKIDGFKEMVFSAG